MPGLSDPAAATLAASAAGVTGYLLTGPARGVVATPSSAFTVTLGPGAMSGAVQVTPASADGDGSFQPAQVFLTNSNRSQTFTYTASTLGHAQHRREQ